MSPPDMPEQAQQLRDLAREFEALRARARGVSYTPGTDALRRIGPLLLKTQDLTATLVVRLGALANSPYTRIPGSHASLECLSSLVIASTQAGNDLAAALHTNPLEGAPFPGYPAYSESDRVARHATAIPHITGHLRDAAHQLDLSATGCRHVATGITRDLADQHGQAKSDLMDAGPSLSPALTVLSLGQGKLHESSQRGLGVTRVATHDGTRVSIAIFRARQITETATNGPPPRQAPPTPSPHQHRPLKDAPFPPPSNSDQSRSAQEFNPAPCSPCLPKEYSPESTTQSSPTQDGNRRPSTIISTAWNGK